MPDIDIEYQKTKEYIFRMLPMYSQIGPKAYNKDLYRIIKLLDKLNNPQNKYRTIHIAGTNGKGSSTHYIASILIQMGYKVGIYSSPHLVDYRERIKIGNQMISKEFVVDFIAKMRECIEQISPSYFELSVAMAFDYFAYQNVDIACIEVGLGGRLDSTNVISPILSVITNIGWDHMQILGHTLPEIAAEKAGIIKPKIPVLIGEYQKEVVSVFEKKAIECQSPIYFAKNEVKMSLTADNEVQFSINGSNILFSLDMFPAEYQHKNIRTSIAAFSVLSSQYPQWFGQNNHFIQLGIQNFWENTLFMGRWMRLKNYPNTILDCAHNPSGIVEATNTLLSMKIQNPIIIIGMVKDKDVAESVKLLPKNAQIIITQASVPRAMPAKELAEIVSKFSSNIAGIVPDAFAAFEYAQAIRKDNEWVIALGSIFLIGDILAKSKLD